MRKEMVKLSIITVCYNEKNLERTCQSIISQTFQNFEWIVIDGGSDQKTQRIWNKYKYRIDKFVSEADHGIFDAMNKGIKLASGKYLNFMNSGDYFHDKNVLQDLSKQFNYNFPVLYGDVVYKTKWNAKKYTFPTDLDDTFWINNCISHQSSFIKKILFKQFGLYNTSYRCAADYEKWLLFRKKGVKFKHLDRVVATFRLGGISNNKRNKDNHLTERYRVQQKYFSKKKIKELRFENVSYSASDNLFSVKLDRKRTHKVITILGIKVKFKIKRKENI